MVPRSLFYWIKKIENSSTEKKNKNKLQRHVFAVIERSLKLETLTKIYNKSEYSRLLEQSPITLVIINTHWYYSSPQKNLLFFFLASSIVCTGLDLAINPISCWKASVTLWFVLAEVSI